MLAPEIAKELQYVEIAASRRIRSLRFGQSRSPLKGSGYEFEAHRKYEVGDDLRRVDWNVSARMQDLYLKKQYEEKEIIVFLAVDLSRSMDFSTTNFSKRLRLLQVAATLGFSASSDNCNFGFLAFTDRIEAYEPPRMGRAHVWRAIDRLLHIRPTSKGTNWAAALQFMRARLKHMSMIFLLSDFIDNPASVALAELPDLKVMAQKHDLVPIIFSDEFENDLPQGTGLLRLRSAETGKQFLLSLSSSHRRRYEALVEERKLDMQDLFYSLGMESLFLKVGEPFLDPLMMLFERRRKV